MNEEIWKPVMGFEKKYEASSEGRIRSHYNSGCSLRKEPILVKFDKNSKGYSLISFYHKSCRKRVLVHRLIAMTFIPNPENKPCVNHKNGNKKDNRVENLEWCTFSENTRHAYATGLIKRKNKKDSKNLLIQGSFSF